MSNPNDIFATIAGGWLGTYAYQGRYAGQPPERFEATFTLPDREGHFTGSVLDDGPMGAADVTDGLQAGLAVRFTKIYRTRQTEPGNELLPIQYEGTLSEDGRFMRGLWMILPRARGRRVNSMRIHGVWDAHRLWHEAEQEELQPEEEGALQELVIGGQVNNSGDLYRSR